jgi:hypothetical protein
VQGTCIGIGTKETFLCTQIDPFPRVRDDGFTHFSKRSGGYTNILMSGLTTMYQQFFVQKQIVGSARFKLLHLLQLFHAEPLSGMTA